MCINPIINLERIKQRVALGGHDVPPLKIERRYYESLNSLYLIIPYCYRVFFFDNSTKERRLNPIAEIDHNGKLEIRNDTIPWWLDEFVIKKI